MTEKELKKLNRYQLLELLVIQTERADQLQEKADHLERRLQEHDLSLLKLGSIADAAIHINGVLESAQKAADLYLESAKKQADELLAHARHQAASMLIQADAKVRSVDHHPQVDCNQSTGKQNIKWPKNTSEND